jgi:hypothetical protein
MKALITSPMTTSLTRAFFAGCLALALAGPAKGLAQAAPAEHQHDNEPTLAVVGKVRCTSCDLKKEKNAHAQCSIYGCQFSVKTESVTNEQGERVKSLEGKTYQILLNDQSKALARKEQKGTRFTLKAKIHADDGVIEVASFEPAKK